ncbi:hypothetical protein WDU94_014881, partial [Cyamophila willieti]
MNSSFGPSISSAGTPDNLKRRSSSRSIKRKKFDDELVECSLPNKISKPRTHSISSPAYDYTSNPVPSTSSATSNVTFEAPAPPSEYGKVKKAQPKGPPPPKGPPQSKGPPQIKAPPPPPAPPSFSSANKRSSTSRKMKPLTQGMKDLGRWKPADDLALINGILQVMTFGFLARSSLSSVLSRRVVLVCV